MHHYWPVLYEDHALVPTSTDPNYHLTTDLADHAIAWVRKVKSIAPDRPFFLYVAPGATHAPHHTPKEWIDRFKGQFDMGWDRYREQTLERQKKLGVVPPDTKLTERSKGLPAWDSLNADQKRLYARMMEVFAAFGAQADHEMGRVVEAVKQLPDADNTLIVYIAGDNGSSAEGGLEGSLNENLFFNGYPARWQDNLKALDELGGAQALQPLPGLVGARHEHALPVDQAGGQPLRGHAQSDDRVVAGAHQGQGRTARAIHPHHRPRAYALR